MMSNRTGKRLLKSKFFLIGAFVCLAIVLLALISPLIIVHSADVANLSQRLRPPDYFKNGWSGHILGTDAMGQDILTRLLIGSRYSLAIAFIAVVLSAGIGIISGMVAGYYGKWVDSIIMRFADVQLSIPTMLLAITIVAIVGPSFYNLTVVLIITSWVQYARVIRGNVILVCNMEFISASRVVGASDIWIMIRQIFPNVMTQVIILGSQQVGYMVLMEAGMSFLGLGVQPPNPSWGVMIADGRNYLQVAPWMVVAPGVALMIMVMACNFLGDGLRDAFDPKMKS
jgi:ABC-type dipeptide/oligopeptide/nickel transport system permease subunit